MKKHVLSLALVWLYAILPASAETVDKIVAKVGEDAITQSDLSQAVRAKKLSLIQSYGDKEGQALFTKFQANALDEMVLEKILESEIRREKIEVGQSDIDVEYRERVRASKMSEADFNASLAGFGLSLPAYRDVLKKDLEQRKFIEKKIMPNVSVSEYDLQKEYEKNRTKYLTFSKFRFIEAYLTPDTFANQDELMKTAQAIHGALIKNAAVGELVKKYSSGAFKEKSGDSGLVDVESLRPEIKRALAALKPGETAQPFQLGNGLYLCKLVSAAEPKPLPFNQVSNAIRARLGDKAVQQELREYLFSVKDQTFVEIMK
jgi:parvulin-like peptidyl-prolyl isomerase